MGYYSRFFQKIPRTYYSADCIWALACIGAGTALDGPHGSRFRCRDIPGTNFFAYSAPSVPVGSMDHTENCVRQILPVYNFRNEVKF